MQQNNDVLALFVEYLARLYATTDDLCYEDGNNIAFIDYFEKKNALSTESIHTAYTQDALRFDELYGYSVNDRAPSDQLRVRLCTTSIVKFKVFSFVFRQSSILRQSTISYRGNYVVN